MITEHCGTQPQVYVPTHIVQDVTPLRLDVTHRDGLVYIGDTCVGVRDENVSYPNTVKTTLAVVERIGGALTHVWVIEDPLRAKYISEKRGVDKQSSIVRYLVRVGEREAAASLQSPRFGSLVHKLHNRRGEEYEVNAPVVASTISLEGDNIRTVFASSHWENGTIPGLVPGVPMVDFARVGSTDLTPRGSNTAPVIYRVYDVHKLVRGQVLASRMAFHDVVTYRGTDASGISCGNFFVPLERPHARDMDRFTHLRQLREGLTAQQWTKMVDVLRLQYPEDTFGDFLSEGVLLGDPSSHIKELIKGPRKAVRKSGMFHGIPGAIIGIRRKGGMIRVRWQFTASDGTNVTVVDSDAKTVGACFVFREEDQWVAEQFFTFDMSARAARDHCAARIEHRGPASVWTPKIVEALRELRVPVPRS